MPICESPNFVYAKKKKKEQDRESLQNFPTLTAKKSALVKQTIWQQTLKGA